MKVFVFLAAISLVTVQVTKANDLDWDGFGEADANQYKLTQFSIVGFNTHQSSTYSDLYPSSKAVDGDSNNGFSHTQDDGSPFWTVQLKEERCIGKVTLVNRRDCCSERLANAVVRAGHSKFAQLNGRCGLPVSHNQAKELGGIIDIYCNPPLLATEVNVVLPTKQYLQLQEVMVEEYPIQRCQQKERRFSIQNAVTEQSSPFNDDLYPSEKAADGFIGSSNRFSHTGLDFDPWLRVNLPETHCISKVVLYNRADCCSDRLSGAVVRAGTSKDITANAQCGSTITAAQAKIPGGILAVYCGPPLKAQYVTVDIPNRKEYLHLREVEIYELNVDPCENDERDLSIIDKPTTQSSYHDNRYSPDKAADGNLDTQLSPTFLCTHTKEEHDPWWLVDLQQQFCISRVVVLNRGDCCSQRLTNAIVRAGTSTNIHANPQCGDVVSPNMAAPPGGTIDFVCDPELMARYISVDIPSDTPSFLQLCEVTVKRLVGPDACQEPDPIVEEAPEPQQPVEIPIPKKVVSEPKLQIETVNTGP